LSAKNNPAYWVDQTAWAAVYHIDEMLSLLMAKQIVNKGIKEASPLANQEEVPFIDLTRQYKQFKYEIKSAINRVLASGIYSSGPEVEAFEAEFAAFCGVPHCIAVSSGVEAIAIALKALGIHPGDEVVTAANAGMHSTSAILDVGALPVFAEIDPVTMSISPEGLIRAITSGTRAVVITHLFGRAARIKELLGITRQFDLPLVEDCFQSHGASVDGKPLGSWGDVGCFCFSPTKNLGALGEAGALITSDAMLADSAQKLRQNGESQHPSSIYPSGRSKSMDEVQAAVLRAKLPLLEEWNLKRRMIAQTYNIHLDVSEAKLQCDYQPEGSVFQSFVVRTPYRELLYESLRRKGIGCGIHFPIPDHLHPACSDLGYLPGMLPETEKTSSEVLSLPCFPELTSWEVEKVCTSVNESLAEF
jgi:dTDP-4-amino-4,6-dideoxygalactose transaminase